MTSKSKTSPRVLTRAQARQVAGGNTGVNRIGCWRIGGTWVPTSGNTGGIMGWLKNGTCMK